MKERIAKKVRRRATGRNPNRKAVDKLTTRVRLLEDLLFLVLYPEWRTEGQQAVVAKLLAEVEKIRGGQFLPK